MVAHRKDHGLASTLDHNPGTNNTVPATVTGAVVEQAFGTTAAASALVQRDGAGQVIVPSTPTAAGMATSKGYVDAAVVSGTTWKELLLCSQQLLSGGVGAILQGLLATVVNELTLADTFIITDGTTTETFTVVGAPVAFGFELGGTAAATLANLVAAINADSTLWSACQTTGLDDYFTLGEDPQFVVYRTAYSAAADRVYGTLNTQSDIQVVEFAAGDQDYRQTSGTQSALPGADPAAKRFGFGRIFGSLQVGDTHTIGNDNTTFTWDGDDDVWQQTGTGSATTEGDGIDVTGGKVTTDVAIADAARKFGAITNRALANGSAEGAGADAGNLAVRTDDADLAVSAANELVIKPQSRLDRLRPVGSWASGSAPDKEPTLAELQAALGTAAGDINNWTFMIEDGTAVGSVSTFLAFKKANAGALADYHLVEMS